MTFQVRRLGAEDNVSLLELVEVCQTKGALFTVTRSPDFFALFKAWGEAEVFGVFSDKELIGCAALSWQTRQLQSSEARIAYVHDVRIKPNFRGSRAYFRLMTGMISDFKVRPNWALATVMDGTGAAPVVWRGMPGFRNARVLGRTRHVGIPLFAKGHWLPGLGLAKTKEAGEVVSLSPTAAWELYQKWTRDRCLAPACPNSCRGHDAGSDASCR